MVCLAIAIGTQHEKDFAPCRLQQIDAEHQAQVESAAAEHRRAGKAVKAELQGQIQSLEAEKDALREQIAQLEQRLVR